MSTEKLATPTTTDDNFCSWVKWVKKLKFLFNKWRRLLKANKRNFYSSKYNIFFLMFFNSINRTRQQDVVTMSQPRRRNVSNEIPNGVSVEICQDVSVFLLNSALLVCCDNVSRGRNNDASSVHLEEVSSKSQIKTKRRLSGISPRRLSVTYPRRPISTPLRRLL